MPSRSAPFRSFTRKFRVARTLRFELIPYDEHTRNLLRWDASTLEETFFGEEAKRNELRPYLKDLWDREIFDFTQRALAQFRFGEQDLQKAYDLFIAAQLARSDPEKRAEAEKALQAHLQALRNKLHKHLTSGYKEKVVGAKRELTAETIRKSEVLPLLQQRAVEMGSPYTDAVEAFARVFSKLQDLVRNHRHLFENKGKKGQLTTRVVEDNFRRFLANCAQWEALERAGIELTPEEREALTPSSYNKFLTQEGVERYNRILGGEAAEVYQQRTEGLNNTINRYNQTARAEGKPRLTLLLPLYRLPGAARVAKIELLEDDEALVAHLRRAEEEGRRLREALESFFSWFFDAVKQSLKETNEGDTIDLNQVYLRPQGVRRVAQEVVSEWAAFNEVIAAHKDAVPLGAILAFIPSRADAFRALVQGGAITPEAFVAQWEQNTLARLRGGEVHSALASRAKRVYANLDDLEKQFHEATETFAQYRAKESKRPPSERWRGMKRAWRAYLEALDDAARLLGDFATPEDQMLQGADPLFLEHFAPVLALRSEIRPAHLLNLARNYLTKLEKHPAQLRIYFQPNFLDNWSWTKIESSLALLGKDPQGKPVLFVFPRSDAARAFQKAAQQKKVVGGWGVFLFQQAKVDKLIPTLVRTPKGVQRVTGRRDPDGQNRQKDAVLRKHLPPEIYEITKTVGFGKENTREHLGDAAFDKFIAYYQEVVAEYLQDSRRGFSLVFRPRYDSWKEFVEDVQRQTVRWQEKTVTPEVIGKMVKEGDLLVFRICNKDLCAHRNLSARQNVHTIIFEALLSEENTKATPPPVRIGSEAKIFYRPAQKGELQPKEVGGHPIRRLTPEGEEEEVKEHHRYYERKLLFHLPLFINDDHPPLSSFSALNRMVNEELFTPEQPIIGVDRGERNLLSYTLIDNQDRLLEAGSLNEINSTNYHALLKQREQERTRARQEWEEVGNITNLKSGYLSQVINVLVKKSLDRDAAIALEGLAFRFAQKRGGQFERSVYLQFENALLNKLELVIEKAKQDRPFQAVAEAPQVATVAKKTERSDFKGQDGIVFFVPAEYTSKTCPHCGYRAERSFNYNNKQDAERQLMERTRFLSFSPDIGGYRIMLRREDDGSELELRSKVTRVHWDPVTRSLFTIQPEDFRNALHAILGSGAPQDTLVGFRSAVSGFGLNPEGEVDADELAAAGADATTLKALFFYLNRILQPRSTIVADDAEESQAVDFFFCPRCGFDTRRAAEYATHPDPDVQHLALITDGDIVGAYNIARKGRLELEVALGVRKRSSRKGAHRQMWDQYVYKKAPTMLW